MERSLAFEGKSKEWVVPTGESHSGVKDREGNDFLLGRTVSSAPDHPLCVEEREADGKSMFGFLAVTNGFTVWSWA